VCAAKPAKIAPTARLRMSLAPTLFVTNGPALQRTGREGAPPAPIHQRAAVRALPPALTRQTAPFQSSETSTDPSFITITSTGRPT